MKPLALFGKPHSALVYVFESHMHMSLHMLMLYSSSRPLCVDVSLDPRAHNAAQKDFHVYLFTDPRRRSP